MAASDATPFPVYGQAFRFSSVILDADGDPVSGGLTGLDSEISKDGGAYADCTNEFTEVGTSGTGYLELSATEMTAYTVMVQIKCSNTGAKTTTMIFYPAPATRGLAGTALPLAASGAAGGVPVSAGGSLDLDAKLAHTDEITAARMGALTDWIDGGRLDLILDARAPEAGGNIATILGRIIGTLAAGTHNPQTGDAFARLGAPAGASIAADIATRLAAADYTAPANATILAIASYLDTEIAAILALVDTEVAAILEDTGTTLPAAIAALPTDADVNAQCDTAIADAALATAADLATVDTVVDALAVTIGAAGAGLTAVGLSAAERIAIAAAIFAAAAEGSETFIEMMRKMRAALLGNTTGATDPASGDPILYKSADGLTTRITGIVDAAGNRTVSATDGS